MQKIDFTQNPPPLQNFLHFFFFLLCTPPLLKTHNLLDGVGVDQTGCEGGDGGEDQEEVQVGRHPREVHGEGALCSVQRLFGGRR